MADAAPKGRVSQEPLVIGPEGKAQTVNYVEEPLAGNVHLDELPDGKWQITHMVTKERMMATGESAELVMDYDTGDAALLVQSGQDRRGWSLLLFIMEKS